MRRFRSQEDVSCSHAWKRDSNYSYLLSGCIFHLKFDLSVEFILPFLIINAILCGIMIIMDWEILFGWSNWKKVRDWVRISRKFTEGAINEVTINGFVSIYFILRVSVILYFVVFAYRYITKNNPSSM